MSVLLPAAFSPSSVCTSPTRTSKSIRSLATTPGKRFVMPRISTIGAAPAESRPGVVASNVALLRPSPRLLLDPGLDAPALDALDRGIPGRLHLGGQVVVRVVLDDLAAVLEIDRVRLTTERSGL